MGLQRVACCLDDGIGGTYVAVDNVTPRGVREATDIVVGSIER